jgi:hypothetical protein
MPGRYGYHWTPCNQGNGSGGPGLAVLVFLIIIGAAIARPAARAADSVFHVVAEVLEIALIVAVSAVGLAVAAGLAVLTIRIRRRVLAARVRRPVQVVSCRVAKAPAASAVTDTSPAASAITGTAPAASGLPDWVLRADERIRARKGDAA